MPPIREAQEHFFETHDGTGLFYRHWPRTSAGPSNRALVLFHRGHEHSGRLQHAVDELGLGDFDMFAWDARGHGRSPGARGDSPSFAAAVKDVDRFVRHIATVHGIPPSETVVVGQSVAAVLVSAWAHDYAPPLRGLVLTAPAFKVRLYVPLARPALALWYRLRGNFFVTSYVKARLLTHDPERIRSYDTDPLVTRAISARVLLGLYSAAERVVDDAQAIRTPTQLLVSDTDWVVHRRPQETFFARLGSQLKERHLLRGFLHDTLGERDRALALGHVRGFVERLFDAETPPGEPADLLQAHRAGHTRNEEVRLGAPLPRWSFRHARFGLTRLSMRTIGRLSEGIRLGLDTGFDSGATLDYVYRNEARGALGIGRLIDRGYLDAIGWRGIRVRKRHLGEAIAAAASALAAEGQPARILDVAAGHGRYVLDAVATLPTRPQSVLLRDYAGANVQAGRSLIAERGLADLARFETGDAFDAASLAALADPESGPNLAVVSGLYELYADNDLVSRSLHGLAQAIAPGGYLVYTGQPWHPQLELIARTLTSHRDGRPWVMRRRTQAELDALVAAAGFRKIEQWIDDWGIFTVSLARRS